MNSTFHHEKKHVFRTFKNYTQAIKNSDWDTVSNMYAEDCVSTDPDGTLYEGRAANLENDQKWGSMMSDFNFNYTNTVESGNSNKEMEVTATMTGEMPMPDGSSIPPSGKTHTFKACMIIGGTIDKSKTENLCRFYVF